MFVDIQTFFLNAFVATESVCIFDSQEYGHSAAEGEEGYYYCSQCLYTYGTLGTVDGGIDKDTCEDGTYDAAYSVYTDCTYRVVNVELLVNETYRHTHDGGSDNADDGTGPYVYTIASCSDADQSSQYTVAKHGERGLPVNYPGIQHG